MTYYQRQEAATRAASAKFQQDYGQAVALYGYDVKSGITTPYPSQNEIEFALMEMKLLKLKQAASTVNAVLNKLDKSGKKSCSCGCSTGSKSTKMVTSATRQTNH